MKTPRRFWLEWKQKPDWTLLSRMAPVLLGWSLIECVAGVITVGFSQTGSHFIGVLAWSIATFLSGWIVIKFSDRWRWLTRNFSASPVKFPPPPSSRWEKERREYAKSAVAELRTVGVLGGLLLAIATFALMPAFYFSTNTSRIAAFPGMAFGTVLLASAIFVECVKRQVRALAAKHWDNCKNELISPAHSRMVDLGRLIEEMHQRSSTAEDLVREVEQLSAHLTEELKLRQTEEQAILGRLDSSRAAYEQKQEVIDALFGEWTRRQREEQKISTRKDRQFDIVMMVVGAVVGALVGYALGVALPWSTLKNLLG